MADYESKRTGEEVEALLSRAAQANVGAKEIGGEVDDVEFTYATEKFVADAIAVSITNALITPV